MVIFDDLEAEQDRLENILDGLDEAQWAFASGAPGWTVVDVVLHLAQTEEAVAASVAGLSPAVRTVSGPTLDQVMDQLVQAERAAPAPVFQRWREARLAAVTALRAADPKRSLQWVDAPLKPATLATTRLAEHWAHGLDITGPLGIGFADTARLSHIAWLAHRSLPYALVLAGEQPQEVFCELMGSRWLIHDTPTDLPGLGRRPGHDLACGRSSPSSRPQDRVCHVRAGCCLAGTGSADRGGDRGQIPG
jgi:uncharacterized protein (TIGR03084 family)